MVLRWPTLLGVLLPGCIAGLTTVRAAFTDITASAGVDYLHSPPGLEGAWSLGASAVLDVNGDGWMDLLVARADQPCLLFVNQRNGTFVDEAAQRGLALTAIGGMGVGDVDNDGDPDILLTPRDGSRFFLLINDGTGHFTEQAVARGADVTTSLLAHRGHSVSLVDFDRDGYLDMYVSEYNLAASAEDHLHSVLLRNRGASAPGHFENVTVAAGMKQPRNAQMHLGFASAWGDFDDDGWPDAALAVDFGHSQFYWNNGDGTFTESGKASGVGLDENGMGIAVRDYDGDGRLDFFVTAIYDKASFDRSGINTGNKLYRNLGHRRFEETSAAAGVARTSWAWGAAFFEYNNDGYPDLLVTTGLNFGWPDDPRAPYVGQTTKPTTLFVNNGSGAFTDQSATAGLTDRSQGRGLLIFDFDNDGDEDVFLTDSYGHPALLRSDASTNGNRWLRFKFRGTTSNRDGYGAIVRVTHSGRTQTALYNPTNSYIAQHEPVLHFGLGAATTADVEVRWPSGIVQHLTAVAANQLHQLTEPGGVQSPPAFSTQPSGGTYLRDSTVVLTAAATGQPTPVFIWQKDGVAIVGANGPTYRIAKLHPADAGRYTVQAINPQGTVTSAAAVVDIRIQVETKSVARWWNEALLDAIRRDLPNPPVHARNLFHLSAAMWDAFWPYETEGWARAQPVFHRESVTPADWIGGREAAQRQAISYAAFRVLNERFKNSVGRARTELANRWLMQQLGYDPDFTGTAGNSPAAVGNRIGNGVLAACFNDGANEANRYADLTGYQSLNEPLIVKVRGVTMADPNTWQPLALAFSVSQNGIPLGSGTQGFIGVNALVTTPFALAKPSAVTLSIDPGPPPRLGTASQTDFIGQAVEVIRYSSMLDPADGRTIDISPGALLNNRLGTNSGTGHRRNPITHQPYAPNVVKRADYGRVLAEFWADGPASETPPGHWNVVHNQITDHPAFERRYGGAGPVLPALEWDVRAYLTLNGAVHDAACAAWGIKRLYDSARPISMIRYLGGLGQSSQPGGPSYHPSGLPLEADLIEVITATSAAAGQRHAHLGDHVGQLAIKAWRGNPSDPRTQAGGVGWVLATEWVPFQLETFVSPAFPGFVSGHSTFSRSAAEVLTLLTGSPYFPGGLGQYHFKQNEFLSFELGPSADLTLQWATFYDAADQAGVSRLFGGIHIAADDFTGRRIGAQTGLDAFLKAHALRSGHAPPRGLINLSSRARAGAGDQSMIVGLHVGGDAARPILVRSVGPELQRFGVTNYEPNPALSLYPAGAQEPILRNDDWHQSARGSEIAQHAASVGAFALNPGGHDAAEVPVLAPGGYTVVTQTGTTDSNRVALAEIYGENLLNLSTRAVAGGGENTLIAGFAVESAEPLTLLIRGVGPTLADFQVGGVLTNPTLRLYRQNPDGTAELIAENDDWSENPKASLIATASQRVGAFTLAEGSADAAIFVQLPGGLYSAHVTGADGSSGVALIEVYLIK